MVKQSPLKLDFYSFQEIKTVVLSSTWEKGSIQRERLIC